MACTNRTPKLLEIEAGTMPPWELQTPGLWGTLGHLMVWGGRKCDSFSVPQVLGGCFKGKPNGIKGEPCLRQTPDLFLTPPCGNRAPGFNLTLIGSCWWETAISVIPRWPMLMTTCSLMTCCALGPPVERLGTLCFSR